jgi:hypothetical protein
VIEFVAMIAMNLVTPKAAAAKHKHLFNKPASERQGIYTQEVQVNYFKLKMNLLFAK